MKVYLDDERQTPDGWFRTWTASQTIGVLESGIVTDLSLDHDLGDEEWYGNGYDVVLWIEEKVATTDFMPPNINIHSANTSAVQKMLAGVAAIERLHNDKLQLHVS